LSGEREAAQALARKLNWEPAGHDDMPGWIPDHRWDDWMAFAVFAERRLAWRKVNAALWRRVYSTDWSPAFETESEDEHLLLVQHDWHGFPDPPEWALHRMDQATGVARCLGCFDYWPETWTAG
jgi:hypothetical protein